MRRFAYLIIFLSISLHGAEVKDFSLPVYKESKTFNLSDYLGKKVIVLNFWASWCTSCIQELPELHELQNKYKDVIFLGINSGERKKLIKKFLRRYKFKYKILVDKTKSVAKLYKVESLPQTIVIGKNKKIIFRGNRPPKSLKKLK